MKILELVIHNFMAIGEASIGLSDKGLVAIQGINADDTSQISNGSGKSTIPDALDWCLYGETARGETGDAVINREAKKGTCVEVLIEDDSGLVYRVARHRKHKTYKNMVRLEQVDKAGDKDLTKGTDKLTQALIDKLVGCSKEVFTSAIYSGQEAMPDLPSMTDRQLKLLIEEAAGIDRLQQAYEIARRTMSARSLETDRTETELAAHRANLLTLREALEDAEKLKTDFEDERTKRHKAVCKAVDDMAGAFDRDRGDELVKQIGMTDTAMRVSRDKITLSENERVHERKLADEASKARNEVAMRHRLFSDQVRKAQDLKHALEHVDDKVGEPCPTCGHVVETGDLDASRDAAKRAAIDAAKAAKQLKSDLEDARERAESADTALANRRATMTDVSAESATLSDLSARHVKLSGELASWRQTEEKIKSLKASADALLTAANPHLATVEKTRERIEKLEAKIADAEKARDEAIQAQTIAEQAVQVFGPAGVRAHILDTVTPHLNVRTAHYLTTLTDGNIAAVWSTISTTSKGELREKFAIDVHSATGGSSFKSLSGGEKRKVRLACAMALQDLVASRATKPIQIWIADEIDHALDEAGLERLMTILDDKARDKGTVLVISHNSLSSWIPKNITVTKKGGRAEVDSSCL